MAVGAFSVTIRTAWQVGSRIDDTRVRVVDSPVSSTLLSRRENVGRQAIHPVVVGWVGHVGNPQGVVQALCEEGIMSPCLPAASRSEWFAARAAPFRGQPIHLRGSGSMPGANLAVLGEHGLQRPAVLAGPETALANEDPVQI
jgi:hypothetical protein